LIPFITRQLSDKQAQERFMARKEREENSVWWVIISQSQKRLTSAQLMKMSDIFWTHSL
jgi:hypothetical protein